MKVRPVAVMCISECQSEPNVLMMDVSEQCSTWCLDQLRLALKQRTAPSDTAAVLIEPLMVMFERFRSGHDAFY